jgi:hypothetical protein
VAEELGQQQQAVMVHDLQATEMAVAMMAEEEAKEVVRDEVEKVVEEVEEVVEEVEEVVEEVVARADPVEASVAGKAPEVQDSLERAISPASSLPKSDESAGLQEAAPEPAPSPTPDSTSNVVGTSPSSPTPEPTPTPVEPTPVEPTPTADKPAAGVLRRLALRRSPLDAERSEATQAALRKLEGLVRAQPRSKAALAARRQALRNVDEDQWVTPVREATGPLTIAQAILPPTLPFDSRPSTPVESSSPSASETLHGAVPTEDAASSQSQTPKAEAPAKTRASPVLVLPKLDGAKMDSYGSDRERQLAEADVEGTREQLGTMSFDFSFG